MADYSKWDKLAQDSDDEAEEKEREKQLREQQNQRSIKVEMTQKEIEDQEEVDRWLKRQLMLVYRSTGQAGDGPPELDGGALSPRELSTEERRTLARFMVIADFETYKSNIERHHDILNVARQNRWLEEDPGTLELLCRIQRQLHKDNNTAPVDEMENRLVCAINTLAAPARAGCSDGYGKIFELFAIIGDPKSDKGWDAKAKYMKKGYAADALFDSMCPPDAFAGSYTIGGLPPCCYVVILVLLGVNLLALWRWFSSGGLGAEADPIAGNLSTSATEEAAVHDSEL